MINTGTHALARTTSRRRFIIGSGALAGSTALLHPRSARLAFATPNEPSRGDATIVVFLRFGADGLSLTPPISSAFDSYRDLRPTLHITPDQALPLDSSNPNAQFPQGLSGVVGLHPALRGLYDGVWAAGQMAVLPASGMPDSESTTRSHFEAQEHVELGTANRSVRSGWLTRVTNGQAPSAPIPGVSTSSGAPTMYRGLAESFSVTNLANVGVDGFRRSDEATEALTAMYEGDGLMNTLGRSTLGATRALGAVDASGGTGYPNTTFGGDMRDIANLLRSNVGLTTALVSIGGWDHHSEQGTLDGQFNDRARDLGDGLTAFVNDLGPAMNETTIYVVSEFGRTIDENSARGTDHGRGGTSFVIGGNVQGGVFGYDYPDVIADSNENRRALPVLTDYRKAFDEVLRARVGVGGSFPTLGALPDLGLLR